MKDTVNEIHKDYLVMNGEFITTKGFDPTEITRTTSVYEVIRVIKGVPLFLEEHLKRLNKSINLLNFEFPIDVKDMEAQIHRLIDINRCYDYNVKIIVNNLESVSPNIFIFFVASSYPSKDLYQRGVHTILYTGERDNPNAKVVSKDFREQVTDARKKANAYEALLVNKNQQITEGSRSNVFFVKNNKVYTASGEKVLMGITRSRIIQLCKDLRIPLEETQISTEFLEECDGLFITGTSPKVLPIATVDEKSYDSINNPVIIQIKESYDALIENYIASKNK